MTKMKLENIELENAEFSGLQNRVRGQLEPFADKPEPAPYHSVVPKPAATLVLVDERGGQLRFVMGRRNKNLKFMPGVLVFPGGSVDPDDASTGSADAPAADMLVRIQQNLPQGSAPDLAKGLMMAAVRELAEETGILLGQKTTEPPDHPDWHQFADQALVPSIGSLRLLARAITPPLMPRRFDTWFFICRLPKDAYIPEGGFAPSGELEELNWVTADEALTEDMRDITRVILADLGQRFKKDRQLASDYPAPFYWVEDGEFHRKLI